MMKNLEAVADAAEAGLRYVGDDEAGLRRVRRGRGFGYLDEEGIPVNGRHRKRIAELAIPPAWDSVWISADPAGHIQATGLDAAGRKQYIYHRDWHVVRDAVKFDRMEEFGRLLSRLRKRADRDLQAPGLSREKVTALGVSVLDRTLIRVGNRRYADTNHAYGLTTLTSDHVDVNGREVRLEFAGKGGADVETAFADGRLARLIARCEELEGQTLFSYPTPQGPAALTSTDINGYLGEVMGGPFTAKDFRTWGASACVIECLAQAGEQDEEKSVLDAIDHAAERLGNTRAVCRTSYVHPVTIDAFGTGALLRAWRRSRTGLWMGRAESALNRILAAA